MNEYDILKYLSLVSRRVKIITSGANWKPEYESELIDIDREISQLRTLIDAEHAQRERAVE